MMGNVSFSPSLLLARRELCDRPGEGEHDHRDGRRSLRLASCRTSRQYTYNFLRTACPRRSSGLARRMVTLSPGLSISSLKSLGGMVTWDKWSHRCNANKTQTNTSHHVPVHGHCSANGPPSNRFPVFAFDLALSSRVSVFIRLRSVKHPITSREPKSMATVEKQIKRRRRRDVKRRSVITG